MIRKDMNSYAEMAEVRHTEYFCKGGNIQFIDYVFVLENGDSALSACFAALL